MNFISEIFHGSSSINSVSTSDFAVRLIVSSRGKSNDVCTGLISVPCLFFCSLLTSFAISASVFTTFLSAIDFACFQRVLNTNLYNRNPRESVTAAIRKNESLRTKTRQRFGGRHKAPSCTTAAYAREECQQNDRIGHLMCL